MTTHLQKWGNSLAVRLPKELLKKTGFEKGEVISIESRDGHIILKPTIRKETLESMIKKITPANRHSEVIWGNPVGSEIW